PSFQQIRDEDPERRRLPGRVPSDLAHPLLWLPIRTVELLHDPAHKIRVGREEAIVVHEAGSSCEGGHVLQDEAFFEPASVFGKHALREISLLECLDNGLCCEKTGGNGEV